MFSSGLTQDPIPPASLALSAVVWKSQLARLKDIAESAYLERNLSSWSCLTVSLSTGRNITGENLDVGRDVLGHLLFFPERRVLSLPSMFRLPLLCSRSIAIAYKLVLPLAISLYFSLHFVQNSQKKLLRSALVVTLVAVLCSWV